MSFLLQYLQLRVSFDSIPVLKFLLERLRRQRVGKSFFATGLVLVHRSTVDNHNILEITQMTGAETCITETQSSEGGRWNSTGTKGIELEIAAEGGQEENLHV